uniref:Uncharacterized protein n=1 Tax=Panagrolaimus sp. PS1159 TaxID=55785 RepID=A0AC35GP98_9BILA
MKAFLFFVLLLFCVGIKGNNKFDCDIKVYCNDNDTLHWMELKEDFDMLRFTPNLNISKADAIRLKHSFCTDDRLGFLLFDEISNWPIACIWTNDAKGGCFPAPNVSFPYDYIPRDEWSDLLVNVRKAAGCSDIAIKDATETQELHICRERCIDCGFTVGSWLLFDGAIFSMLITIGLHGMN